MTAVLVTGAAGFIGQATCQALLSAGHGVTGAIRNAPGQMTATPVVVGDIGPETDWSKALAGCGAVVHLAARVHVMPGQAAGESNDFHRINVESSVNLARQAARAGVRRFVFLSSVKVNGDASGARAFTESDPPAPADAYGASKAEAEIRLRAFCAETRMELVILRPPLVYGPGVRANFLDLMRSVDNRWPLPLASIENRRSLIYVGNLANAIETCLNHPAAANRTFLVSDDRDVSTSQLVEAVAAALGTRARLFPFPPSWLRAVGRATGRNERIARLIESLQVEISRIKTELGWQPPFSLERGLGETVRWYRSRRK